MVDIALALLIVDDKVLLFKRENKKGDKFAGLYGLPGGHVEEKENTKEAAVRETWEETCVRMKKPIFVNTYKFEDNKIFLYAEEIDSTRGVKLNHEHTDFKVFDPDELGKNPEIIPTTKFMYKDYLNKRGDKPKETKEELDDYAHVNNAEPDKNNFKLGKNLSLLNIALNESKGKTYKVYHGTNEKFDKFDLKKATQGIVWFTDNPDSIIKQEHGGMGNKIIMTRYITLNNPAGWDEYDKYGLQQLQDRGYDGAILPGKNETVYFVFSNKSIHTKP